MAGAAGRPLSVLLERTTAQMTYTSLSPPPKRREENSGFEYDVNILCGKDEKSENFASELQDFLQKHNVHCAVPWQSFQPGWIVSEIPYIMMKKSRITVFVLCENFLERFGIVERADTGNVIIVQIGPCAKVESFSRVHILDYTNGRERPHVFPKILEMFKSAHVPADTECLYVTPDDELVVPVTFVPSRHGDSPSKNLRSGPHVRQELMPQLYDAESKELISSIREKEWKGQREPSIEKLLRENLPYWFQKKQYESLSECLLIDHVAVRTRAINCLQELLLEGYIHNEDVLGVLKNCYKALEIQTCKEELLFLVSGLICTKRSQPGNVSETVQRLCALMENFRKHKNGPATTTVLGRLAFDLSWVRSWKKVDVSKDLGSAEQFEKADVMRIFQMKTSDKIAILFAIWVQLRKLHAERRQSHRIVTFLRDVLHTMLEEDKPRSDTNRELFLMFAIPAIADIIKHNSPGGTQVHKAVLPILERLLGKRYCRNLKKAKDKLLRPLRSLMLNTDELVKQCVIKLIHPEDTRSKANWPKLSCAIMTKQIEEDLTDICLQLDKPESTLSEGYIELTGLLARKPCCVRFRIPSRGDVCEESKCFDRLAERFKDEAAGHELLTKDTEPVHGFKMYNELRMLMKLNDPTIVTLLAYQWKPLPVYYVVERSIMGTLEDDLIRRRKGSVFRPLPDLLRILTKALQAILHCHQQGILVVNINTAGFSLLGDEANPEVKLTDLKLAKDMGDTHGGIRPPITGRLSHAAIDMLPTRFMAPETFYQSMRSVSKATDAYTFGCFMFQTLTYNGMLFGELGGTSIWDIMDKVHNGYRQTQLGCIPTQVFCMLLNLTMRHVELRTSLPAVLEELNRYRSSCPREESDAFGFEYRLRVPEKYCLCREMETGIPRRPNRTLDTFDTDPHSSPDNLDEELYTLRRVGEKLGITEKIPICWPVAAAVQRLRQIELKHFTSLIGCDKEERSGTVVIRSVCDEAKSLVEYMSTHSSLALQDLVRMFAQLTEGLQELNKRGFVIGNVQPEHTLVTENPSPTMLISSYGRVQTLNESPYDVSLADRTTHLGETRLNAASFRYASPETLQTGELSVGSDVFTFGVFMWAVLEMYCRQREDAISEYDVVSQIEVPVPYEWIHTPNELQRHLEDGETLPDPDYANLNEEERDLMDKCCQIMSRCWAQERINRPSFAQIKRALVNSRCDAQESIRIPDHMSKNVLRKLVENLQEEDNWQRKRRHARSQSVQLRGKPYRLSKPRPTTDFLGPLRHTVLPVSAAEKGISKKKSFLKQKSKGSGQERKQKVGKGACFSCVSPDVFASYGDGIQRENAYEILRSSSDLQVQHSNASLINQEEEMGMAMSLPPDVNCGRLSIPAPEYSPRAYPAGHGARPKVSSFPKHHRFLNGTADMDGYEYPNLPASVHRRQTAGKKDRSSKRLQECSTLSPSSRNSRLWSLQIRKSVTDLSTIPEPDPDYEDTLAPSGMKTAISVPNIRDNFTLRSTDHLPKASGSMEPTKGREYYRDMNLPWYEDKI